MREIIGAYEARLCQYIADHKLTAEHLRFDQSCHSVAEAAEAVNATAEDFVKNICMITDTGELIVGIVKGEHSVSTSRAAKAVGATSARLARPDELVERTGYEFGGTPSFGFEARFLIDPAVMERAFVFTGGGSATSLMRVNTEEMVRANGGTVVRIRK